MPAPNSQKYFDLIHDKSYNLNKLKYRVKYKF